VIQASERYHKGVWAEWVAALYLMCKGYRIVARRYKTRYGEVDLIARRLGVVAFVEVKARPTRTVGLEAITPKSQQRILNAATAFVQRHPVYQNYVWRFDALVVSPRALPYHMTDAWRAS
jgi:putative endonuclease